MEGLLANQAFVKMEELTELFKGNVNVSQITQVLTVKLVSYVYIYKLQQKILPFSEENTNDSDDYLFKFVFLFRPEACMS